MVDFNNLTSSETDRVIHFVTTSVEEELGRRHRGVYWNGLSFSVSLEATMYETQQRLKWRSKCRPRQVVPNYRLRQVVPNYRLRQVVPNYRFRQVVPNHRLRQVVPNYRLRQVVLNYRLRQVVPNHRLRQVVPNYILRQVVLNYRLRQGIGECADVGKRWQCQMILSRASITREMCLRPCCQCQINWNQ